MDLDIKRFEEPDQIRRFPLGTFEVIRIGNLTIGRASYEPGWRWSEHVGPLTGAASCKVEHAGVVLSGAAAVRMDDGHEFEMKAGDLFTVPAGHDSWVLGDEPYVSLHFLGADEYAAE
jgi:quercetin dioxygenase-like cupin family protein